MGRRREVGVVSRRHAAPPAEPAAGRRELERASFAPGFPSLLLLAGLAFLWLVGCVLAGGRAELVEDGLQPGAGGFGVVAGRFGWNRLLHERRVAHVEQIAALGELEALLANIPLGTELDKDPIAWRAVLASQLRREAAAVECHPLGHLRAGQFGERRVEVAEVHQVVEDLAGGHRAFPTGDERPATAAL